MILDAETHEQVAAVDRILRGVEGLDLPGRLKTELFASVFETNTASARTSARSTRRFPFCGVRQHSQRSARGSRSPRPARIRSPGRKRSRS